MVDYTQSDTNLVTVPLRKLYAPALISGALIIWAAVVYPFSKYGDSWAIWPAFATFPIVVIWHAVLIFKLRGNSKLAFVSALVHLALFVPLWLGCLKLISKDSV